MVVPTPNKCIVNPNMRRTVVATPYWRVRRIYVPKTLYVKRFVYV